VLMVVHAGGAQGVAGRVELCVGREVARRGWPVEDAALELREMIFADVNANYNYYVEADSHDDSHLVARHSVNPCRAQAVVVWRL